MIMSIKNIEVREYIISKISKRGFKSDAYGNYRNASGEIRFKFNPFSYRIEKLIDTKPKSWVRIGGGYYKNEVMK